MCKGSQKVLKWMKKWNSFIKSLKIKKNYLRSFNRGKK